jgi:hypothetical protein
MLKPTIDNNAIKALVVELKEIDPGLARQLSKDIKNELMPVAGRIKNQISDTPPLSGLANHNGRTKWTPWKIGVSVTPGSGWGRSFVAFTNNSGAGNKIAEFAGKGKKSYVKTTQGIRFIDFLDAAAPSPGRQGRFFFQAYRNNKNGVIESTQNVIDNYVDIVNRKLN